MEGSFENYSWRTEVNDLLEKACHSKLVRGGISLALNFFNEAELLLPKKNSDTWKAHINYRKAHIYFRYAGLESAEGNENNAKEYLENAIEFFQEAGKSKCFAQLSKIYSIPAFLKLGVFAPGSTDHIQKIKDIYTNIENNDTNNEIIQIDTNRVNLIEISAYYACFWTPQLEGRSVKLSYKDDYTIFSSNDSFERINMTKEFAYNEINDIIKSNNYDIAFRVGRNEFCYCNKKTKNIWNKCQSKIRIGVILAMFNEVGKSPSKWFADNLNSSNFKKYKNDLKDWLSVQTGIDKAEIFTSETSNQESFSKKFRLFVAAPKNFRFQNFSPKNEL